MFWLIFISQKSFIHKIMIKLYYNIFVSVWWRFSYYFYDFLYVCRRRRRHCRYCLILVDAGNLPTTSCRLKIQRAVEMCSFFYGIVFQFHTSKIFYEIHVIVDKWWAKADCNIIYRSINVFWVEGIRESVVIVFIVIYFECVLFLFFFFFFFDLFDIFDGISLFDAYTSQKAASVFVFLWRELKRRQTIRPNTITTRSMKLCMGTREWK